MTPPSSELQAASGADGTADTLLDGGTGRPTAEQREHAATLRGFASAVTLGSVFWCAFALMDCLIAGYVYHASIMAPVLVRLGLMPVLLFFVWRCRRKPAPGPRLIFAMDVLTFSSTSAAFAIISSALGGVTGPYTAGVMLVLICRNAFIEQPFRRALVPNAAIVIAHFITLGLCEWLQPGSVLRLGVMASLLLLMLSLGSISIAAVLLMAAANNAWTLRKRVFEARSLGRYRLIARIAEGGHGEVWSAYHLGLGQQVAIKVLRSEIADDERAQARFEREIDALCGLRHPHTVRMFDYGLTADGICYYVMELLEGGTLAQRVTAEGRLPPSLACHLALQVTNALAEAHQRGIVHRDIKPENVFVLSSDVVSDFAKLLDFGVAKRRPVHGAAESRVTGTGMVVGTPAFMAPEVAMGVEADFRSDVYGVGALLHFMLLGRPPDGMFSVPTAAEQQASAQHSLPPDLEHVMMRCLSRDPDKRYPNASELAAALASVKAAHTWQPSKRDRLPATASSAEPTQTSPSSRR